jgi:hypothetical protein
MSLILSMKVGRIMLIKNILMIIPKNLQISGIGYPFNITSSTFYAYLLYPLILANRFLVKHFALNIIEHVGFLLNILNILCHKKEAVIQN